MTDTLTAPSPGPTSGPGSRAAKPQQILDAAREHFLKDGFSATSMDAIAKTAGVSKATVYAHFSSKEELFGAMMSTECRRTWPELLTPQLSTDDPRFADPAAKIREVAHRYMRFIIGGYPVALLRVVAAEASRTPELGQLFYDMAPGQGRKRFAELLQLAEAKGLLKMPDPLKAADYFFAMLRSDTHLRCLVGMEPPSDAELGAHADEVIGMFFKLYAPAPASS